MVGEPIPFQAYEPDKGRQSGASLKAKGVLSQAKRFVPLPSPEAYRAGFTTNGQIIGGFGCYSSTNSPHIFVGDPTYLYKLQNRAPVNVSQAGNYTADPSWAWNFAQFGDNVVAVARGADPQRYILGSSTLFEDLSAEAPQGDVVFRIREHLWICNGREANWSGFNDITAWNPADLETQAGQTFLGQELGGIVAGIGGEQGCIFQERGLVRVTYTGGTTIWALDEIEGGRGACGPRAVSRWGRGAFHASEDGFYYFDGQSITPIGQDKVNREFTSRLNYPMRSRTVSAIDTDRKCWMVAFPTGASQTPDFALIYSWADDRWTYDDDLELAHLFEMPREGVSMDDSSAVTALWGTAVMDDLVGVSMDDPAWQEGRKAWGGANLMKEVVTFDGSNRPAEIETGEFEPTPGAQSYVSEVSPQVDADPSAVTCTLLVREHRHDEAEIVLDEAGMNEYGTCDVRGEARFMRARIGILAGANWTEASGILTDARASGGR